MLPQLSSPMKPLTLKIIASFWLLGCLALAGANLLYLDRAYAAQNVGDIINDLDKTAKDSKIFTDKKPAPTIFQYIGRFINLFLAFLGIVFLIIVIYSGFNWMMAKGNQQMVDESVKYIESASIGIIIIILSYILVNFLVFRIMGIGTGLTP